MDNQHISKIEKWVSTTIMEWSIDHYMKINRYRNCTREAELDLEIWFAWNQLGPYNGEEKPTLTQLAIAFLGDKRRAQLVKIRLCRLSRVVKSAANSNKSLKDLYFKENK
jgi:hypothetical protein